MAERAFFVPVYRSDISEPYQAKGIPLVVGNEISHSPQVEARALLPLLKLPHESVESVRKLITVSESEAQELRRDESNAEAIIRFRCAVLYHFEVLTRIKPGYESEPEAKIAPIRKRHRVYRNSHGKRYRSKIVDALRNGESTAIVAARFGLHSTTVLRFARNAGIRLKRSWGGRKRVLNSEQIAAIRAAIRSGANHGDVARRFGVSKMTLNRYGLTLSKINGQQKSGQVKLAPAVSPWTRRKAHA